jgi:predicted phosphodiesterase
VKILALYDIHGNPDALEAVLADPRAADPDVVVIGGDAVPGPEAAATLDRLGAITSPTRWLRGNGEREVADAAGRDPAADDPSADTAADDHLAHTAADDPSAHTAADAPSDTAADDPSAHTAADAPSDTAADDLSARTAAITAREIGAQRAKALGALPLTVELDGILFCHASPRRDDEMLTRLSTAQRWSDALRGIEARLVVGGHTHQQDDRVVAGTRFINAGSVGLPYEGDGAARWLWIDDGVPELRHTAYDAARAGARFLAAGWPDEQSVGAALIEGVEPIVVTRIFEATVDPHTD